MSALPRVACYGELLLRLSPPVGLRLRQASAFDVQVGGAEANVAVALAQWGVPVEMHSCVPDGALGDRALDHLRRYGVDVVPVARGGQRLGIYYYEPGAAPRPGQVIYDRAHSSFAEWDVPIDAAAFQGVGLLHLTGISPAVSAAASQRCHAVVRQARAAGATLSLDLNFRSLLWQWGPATASMPPLVAEATVIVADQTSAQQMLGVAPPDASAEPAQQYATLGAAIAKHAPNAQWVAFTHRSSTPAGDAYQAFAWLPREARLVQAPPVSVAATERIGAGDAFTAGVLYGWLSQTGIEQALRLGLAAAALKHTLTGDALVAPIHELHEQLGGSPARLKR